MRFAFAFAKPAWKMKYSKSVCDGISDASEMKWNECNLYISETQISVVYLIIHICIQTTELAISVWNLYVRRLNFIRHRCVRAHSSFCHATHRQTYYTNYVSHTLYSHIQNENPVIFCLRILCKCAHNHVSIFPAMPLCSRRDNFIEMEIFHNRNTTKSVS